MYVLLSYTHAAFTVGFEQAEYSFGEDSGGEVCVVIEEGGIQGDQSIQLTLGASDGTATGESLFASFVNRTEQTYA